MLNRLKRWISPENKVESVDPRALRAYAAKSFAGASFDAGVFENYIANGYLNISDYNAYLLYESAAPLSIVVSRIADSVSLLDPVVVQGDEIVENSPFLEALKNPGFGATYLELMRDYATAYLLTNNGYAITDFWKRTIRVPKPFNVSYDLSSGDGYISSYKVTTHNVGATNTFQRDDLFNYISPDKSKLIHIKGETNNSGVIGRSPLQAIFTELGQRIEGGKHNLSLLQNGMRASGAFSFDHNLSVEQIGAIKEGIELCKSGAENAGVTLILGNGGKYSELSTSNKDMDYKTVIQMANESVTLKYKVPLPIVTSSKQTLDNFSQAMLAFYDDAVFPIAETCLNGLTRLLELPDGQFFSFNRAEIPAVRKRRFEEALIKKQTNSFSTNEIRQEFNALPLEEGGEEVLVPATNIPLGLVESDPDETDEPDEIDETEDLEDDQDEEE